MYVILIILYVLVAITIVISLLVNGMRPSKTLAWLLAIFTIPVGGILLYLMLGRNRRKNKLLRLNKSDFVDSMVSMINGLNPVDGKYRKIQYLIQKNCNFPATNHNHLLVLKDGKTTFEAIFDALENAKTSIHLQYYIYEEGELADSLLSLFMKKVKEGVKIRMIYDGIGSFSLSRSYINTLKEIGVEVYPFLPFRFGRFLSSLNYRNHRKIIVVDGEIAFTGGINISDKYVKGDPSLGQWHDMHLRLKGTSAYYLNTLFAMDWYLVNKKRIKAVVPNRIDMDACQNKTVQIVSSGPDDDFPTIEQVYASMINEAHQYLYITNPYIIPGQAILKSLQTAALSGVDVRLLISEHADSKLVNWSVRSYFESMLKSGIRIYLFPDGFLHSKIIVSDDAISTIGTANIDVRSFEQNYEVNAIVYDEDFAVLLRDDFLKDTHKSKELNYAEYIHRPLRYKLKEGAAKIFSPIL
ncbi:MAG: cardiolipin synthase [Bacteroidota bacterium]